MRREAAILAFNRGVVSRLGLARVDITKLAYAASTMVNWMPRVLGSMMLRPGLGYIGSVKSNNQARMLRFVFSTDDYALVEITNTVMRVWVDDALITRPAVSSAVANGNFDATVASWTDSDEVGGTSQWAAGGYLQLTGNGTAAAIRDQQVTVAAADQGVEHALRIVIERGPVTLLVGSTAGDDDYIAETELDTGTHSLAFTPTGDFHIRFMSTLERSVYVDSCNVEAAGVMEITAPWTTAALRNIRYTQSGSILFVACKDFLQRKIERRSARSWSLVWYLSDDGPYLAENVTETTIAASGTTGNITLTASRSLFKAGHIGSIWSITSAGQSKTKDITAENTFSDPILVTAAGEQRRFTITLAGTWVATVTLQRAIGETGTWADVGTFTANTAQTYNDELDNQIVYYRIGVKTGGFTSGTINAALEYPLGAPSGVVRITDFTDDVTVGAEVLYKLGGTAATKTWREGSWSTVRGWPSAVEIYEGRLWFAGKNGIWGSISDDYYNYDFLVEGDSGVINRTIGSGPVDDINWILPLQRLMLGAEGAEWSARASSLDEILTPTNFNIKKASTQGSKSAVAEQIDSRGVYVQRGGTRLMELAIESETGDYTSTDLMLLAPELGLPSIVHVAVQRLPDTRIHCVRSDGTVAVLVYDRAENVAAWVEVETSGSIEDVVVLPGDNEDAVYYVVNRTHGRFLEKWALESEAQGATVSKVADSFVSYSGPLTTIITGLSHLEGEEVVVWGNGKDLGTKTVVGGQIDTLSEGVTTATVGLAYSAQWEGVKLSQLSPMGFGLTKNVTSIGLVLADYYPGSLQYGPSFDAMDDMPLVENGVEVSTTEVRTEYDEPYIPFPGEWDADARVCLQANAPRPCTVLAAVVLYEDGL